MINRSLKRLLSDRIFKGLDRLMLWGIIAIGLYVPNQCYGEEPDLQRPQSWHLHNPVEIMANRLELRRPQHMAVYSGQVVASQEEYQLRCNRLEVHWSPETKKISQLVAKGEVSLETEEGVAKSGVGVLDLGTKVIVLTGSPLLVRGEESVEGEQIIYSISERKSTVMGGKGKRVKSRLIPGVKH